MSERARERELRRPYLEQPDAPLLLGARPRVDDKAVTLSQLLGVLLSPTPLKINLSPPRSIVFVVCVLFAIKRSIYNILQRCTYRHDAEV